MHIIYHFPSRIGHVFRKRRPYNGGADGIDTMIRNSLRMAHVWMDDYVVRLNFFLLEIFIPTKSSSNSLF